MFHTFFGYERVFNAHNILIINIVRILSSRPTQKRPLQIIENQ
jgi:hypothetical protein